MNLQCLTRYDDLGASSRVRFGQYQHAISRLLPELAWQRHSLLDATYLLHKYAGRGTLHDTLRCYAGRIVALQRGPAPALRWIEKEVWPWAPAWLELRVLEHCPYVLDLDDAIFHNYDQHPLALVRRLWGRKIDRLMQGAALVTAGNAHLAQRALAAGARRVEVIPTVVDLERYPRRTTPAAPSDAPSDAPIDIAWIGSPATVPYLQGLAEPLRHLAARCAVRLVVIGGGAPAVQGIEVVVKPWSADTEVADLAACHIGVMPLPDSPWERGKCGYKLIQYMACGLPVVASPVGANCQIVQPGRNGMLATTSAQWLGALAQLTADPALREQLGRAGRDIVEQHYSVQAQAPRLAALLREAAGRQ